MTSGLMQYLFAAILGAILGTAYFINVYLLSELTVVINVVFINDAFINCWWPFMASAFFGAAVTCCILHIFSRALANTRSSLTLRHFNMALLPLLLLVPIILLPPEIYSPLMFTLAAGLAAFRLAAIWPGLPDIGRKLDSRWNPAVVILLTAACIIFYAWAQIRAVNTLFMDYADWALFLTIIDNTLKGKWFFSNEFGRNFLGIHFIPGVIILLAPYVWIFCSMEAFLALNSILIYCGVIFVYLFARKLKIEPGASLLLAVSALLYPSLSNVVFTIFYGFHDIITIFPLLFLFFWLWESGHKKSAFAIFLVTLTIRETIPVFWMGMGVLFFCLGYRRRGTAFFLISLVYFLLLIKLIIPALSPQHGYEYTSRFANMGGSIQEIVFSPIYNSRAFLTAIFRPCNFYFFGMLLVPLGLLSLCRPWFLLPGITLIAAVCLQETDQLQNISIHYQTEFIVLNFISAVLCYRDVADGRFFRWHRLLLWNFSRDQVSRNLCPAVLIAVLLTSMLSFYFFGKSMIGKNSLRAATSGVDSSRQIKAVLERFIPPGAGVTTALHCRLPSFIVLRNNISFYDSTHPKLDDYAILDLNELISIRYCDDLRKALLRNPDYNIVFNDRINSRQVMIFRKEPHPAMQSPLIRMTECEWQECGEKIDPGLADISVRHQIVLEKEQFVLKFFVRLERPVKSDIEIDVAAVSDTQCEERRFLFGDGCFPADFATVGDIYTFNLVLSQPPQNIKSVRTGARLRTP